MKKYDFVDEFNDFMFEHTSKISLDNINKKTLQNAIAVVTPAAVGVPDTLANFFNVSLTTFIVVPCGCCVTVSVENISDGTAINVTNANIIFDRVA